MEEGLWEGHIWSYVCPVKCLTTEFSDVCECLSMRCFLDTEGPEELSPRVCSQYRHICTINVLCKSTGLQTGFLQAGVQSRLPQSPSESLEYRLEEGVMLFGQYGESTAIFFFFFLRPSNRSERKESGAKVWNFTWGKQRRRRRHLRCNDIRVTQMMAEFRAHCLQR